MEKFVAIIMAVFAVPLLVGGAYLLSLGGSPYYLIRWHCHANDSIFIVQKTLERLRGLRDIYRCNTNMGALGIWILLVGPSNSLGLPTHLWRADAIPMGL